MFLASEATVVSLVIFISFLETFTLSREQDLPEEINTWSGIVIKFDFCDVMFQINSTKHMSRFGGRNLTSGFSHVYFICIFVFILISSWDIDIFVIQIRHILNFERKGLYSEVDLRLKVPFAESPHIYILYRLFALSCIRICSKKNFF